MKKKIGKMTLSRETLRRLEPANLKEAEGALAGGSFDRTCQSLCFVCPETWPIEN